MKEFLHLIISCIICWCHGFSTKTGAEPWFVKRCVKENLSYPKESQRRLSF
jgi:hypothetical protein